MKHFSIILRVLKYLAAVYAVACIVLSTLVSLNVFPWEIIEHRRPFIIAEVVVSEIKGSDNEGHFYGYDTKGFYVGFRGTTDEYPEGLKVVSVMVYNPLTNWADDIAARYDIASFE